MGGLLPLSVITFIWTGMENQVVPQRFLLIVLGAGLGALAFYSIGELIRPSAAQQPQAPMTNDDKRPPNISGNNNVVSIGQTGGVTAGTYINQVVQPQLKLLDQKDQINPDGTHTTTFAIEVFSQTTPAFLAIDIAAQGIMEAKIMPPAVNGVAMMQLRNVRRSSTEYHAELTSPRGQYAVSVRTQGQTPVKLSYQF